MTARSNGSGAGGSRSQISDDGLTYTFTLRQGVKFHNGDAFSPQDVIDTWKMHHEQDFAALSDLGWDKITDITAPDDHTVVMTTSEVYAPFCQLRGGDNSSVISPIVSAIAKAPTSSRPSSAAPPIGTGPVKFNGVERQAVRSSSRRIADYWGDTDAPGPSSSTLARRQHASSCSCAPVRSSGRRRGISRPGRVDEALGIEG